LLRLILILAALACPVAACGGGTTDESRPPTTMDSESDPASGTGTASAAAAEPEDETPSAPSAEEGTATVTLGGRTWNFALSRDARELCSANMSGTFFVNLFGVDEEGQQIVVTITAPTSGGQAVVGVGDPDIAGERWIADVSVYEKASGFSVPDGIGATVEVHGNMVSGVGTFYEDRALSIARQTGGDYVAGTLEGTFQATCPLG